jgi:D-arabinose 1-dehydrogenase-like Zn-dependent alcohol dehydrogenase
MKGKVAVQAGPEIIEYKEYDLPTPKEGALLLKVRKTNVCGSDIHIWEGKHPVKNCVFGHELIGEVHELGEGVTTDYAGQEVKVGDRVVPVYYLTCQKCDACNSGNFNLCENGYTMLIQSPDAWPHFTGSYSTHYYVSPNQYFYKVPDNVTDSMAAGANCGLSQMLYSIDKCGLNAGETVLILGAGGLGLYSAAIAKEKGAKVIVFDGVKKRLDEIKNFGADHVFDINEYNTLEKKTEILKKVNGKAPDVVIDLTGVPQALNDAIRLVAPLGKIIEVGNVNVGEDANVKIVPGLITRKCITLMGVLRYQPWYLNKAIHFLERNADKYPFDKMSDREYSLEEAGLALEKSRAREVARAAIDPNK